MSSTRRISYSPLFADSPSKTILLFWNTVHTDGLWLIDQLSFGSWDLPSDWILLTDNGVESYDNEMYGYAAVRIPLYLAIDEPGKKSPGFDKLMAYFKAVGYLPRWVDVDENAVALLEASAGMYATYALAADSAGEKELSRALWKKADTLIADDQGSYYSYTLYLLAKKANFFR